MDYEKKYKESLERAREQLEGAKVFDYKDGQIAYDIRTTIYGIFPELKKSEGERIRKEILEYFQQFENEELRGVNISDWIAWLEKQGDYNRLVEEMKERKELLSKEKEKATSTNDKLSLGGRIAILEELLAFTKKKQAEQKPTEVRTTGYWNVQDIEPRFKVGQTIKKENFNSGFTIVKIEDGFYYNNTGDYFPFTDQDNWELVEQKPTDKVEPKFSGGDWVVNNTILNLCHIVKVEHGQYICDDCSFPITKENEYHLWTLQDAKDGDVLVCPKYAGDIIPNIFIFKNINIKDNDVFCYCSFLDTFRTEGYVANADPINTDFCPATKEQRDTLIKAMANAGYTFDFEKKELIKIEHKYVWSEEDEKIVKRIDSLLYAINESYFEDIHAWLESVRPQNRWKPSDEQLEAFEHFVRCICESGYDNKTKLLRSLLFDLKKLMEE